MHEKFLEWESSIQDYVVERNREIRGLVLAVLSKSHHLQLGAPGVGKSYLVNTALSMIEDAKVMSILCHGYMPVEEVHGPLSLSGLEEDRYVRKTGGYLPWADLVFADEIFRAPPSLLNANLWAFNERLFRNDGEVTTIPLISAFFASNERPADVELQALDDRIHLRYEVKPLVSPSSRAKMLKNRLSWEPADSVLSLSDIHAAHGQVEQVEIPDDVIDTILSVQNDCAEQGVRVSDRKVADALRVIQASAFLCGRTQAASSDVSVLGDMFWADPSDRQEVQSIITDYIDPIEKEAMRLLKDLNRLDSDAEEVVKIDQEAVRKVRANQLYEKVVMAKKEWEDLKGKVEGPTPPVLDEVKSVLFRATRLLITKGYGVSPTNAGGLPKVESSDPEIYMEYP